MKFISWNVNGIVACNKEKNFEKILKDFDADFFCIQELKTNNNVQIEFKEYKQFWNYSNKKGYSGTAIFAKKQPIKVEYGLIDEYGDNFDTEGRVITLEYSDFYLVTCYTPNSQSSIKRLNYRLEFDDIFIEYIKNLNNRKGVIICGDLNIAYQNIDICSNYRQRNINKNEMKNFFDEEKFAFTEILNIGFIDTFRYFHPQSQKFSWWFSEKTRKENIGWRLDYFLVSKEYQSNIRKADVHDEILGSDHCPIELELNI